MLQWINSITHNGKVIYQKNHIGILDKPKDSNTNSSELPVQLNQEDDEIER